MFCDVFIEINVSTAGRRDVRCQSKLHLIQLIARLQHCINVRLFPVMSEKLLERTKGIKCSPPSSSLSWPTCSQWNNCQQMF